MNVDKKAFLLAMAKAMMNKKQLAEKSGVSRFTVNQILNHEQRPNTETIGKLAAALDLSPADIIEK